MLKTLALTGCLGLALAAPLAAETYTDPDRAWWTGFLDAVDGRAPDLEALARQDPDYLAADEFTRDAVLARVVARLQAQQPRIDPATAELVLSIGATLGDFDAGQGGFRSASSRRTAACRWTAGARCSSATGRTSRFIPPAGRRAAPCARGSACARSWPR